MKKRTQIIVIILGISVFIGCVSKVTSTYIGRKEAKVLKKAGPMDKWVKRCDKEILDIPYASNLPGSEYLKLDIYYNNHVDPLPIIVNIHGGGWETGDKRDSRSVYRCRYLANNGYVVANVNYRLLPGYPVQTQIEDVMGAVIWIKENAGKYGADPKRVGVMGSSAGGQLAAMIAWASDDPFFKPTAHAKSKYDSDIGAAALFYGVYDIEKTLKGGLFPIIHPTGLSYYLKAKKGSELDKLIRKTSPKYHVTSDIPPTLFLCGDADMLKLYPQSVEFEKLLSDEGIETDIYTAKGANHSFDVDYSADYTQEAMKKTVEWFDRFVR